MYISKYTFSLCEFVFKEWSVFKYSVHSLVLSEAIKNMLMKFSTYFNEVVYLNSQHVHVHIIVYLPRCQGGSFLHCVDTPTPTTFMAYCIDLSNHEMNSTYLYFMYICSRLEK